MESIGYIYTAFDVNQNSEGTVDVIGAIDQPLPLGLLERGPFHFILCTEAMEHVADWDMAFKNFAALLAPHGRLLIPNFSQVRKNHSHDLDGR